MTPRLPPFTRSLSWKLLLLTIAFVMVAEVLIYVPSAARFRQEWLLDRLASGHLAALSVVAAPEGMVTKELEAELLRHAGVQAVDVVLSAQRVLMLAVPEMPEPQARFELGTATPWALIRHAFALLASPDPRVIAVSGPSPKDMGVSVTVVVDEAPLRAALLDFSGRILWLSVIISLVTASLVYLALLVLTVRPMQRLVEAMMAFKRDPESEAPAARLATDRRDEVGIAQRELIALQAAVRQALRQQQRLATLGAAVTRINHDIRGILSSATLLSERLLESPDPEMRRTGPRILASLERAAQLCGQTLDFTRDGVMPLRREALDLHALVAEVGDGLPGGVAGVGEAGGPGPRWLNQVPPGLTLHADRDQLLRVLGNLGRNALEAGACAVTLSVMEGEGRLTLLVEDDGPGLAPRAQENLFQPFAGSTKANGTGLGLAIAREVMRAHGGDIRLVQTSGSGTSFALGFPSPA